MAGFENERVITIASPRTVRRVPRSDPPAPMTLVAQQGGKASVTVKMWPAQPVDGAISRDQCSAVAVADQGVVLDPFAHFSSLRRMGTAPIDATLNGLTRPVVSSGLPINSHGEDQTLWP